MKPEWDGQEKHHRSELQFGETIQASGTKNVACEPRDETKQPSRCAEDLFGCWRSLLAVIDRAHPWQTSRKEQGREFAPGADGDARGPSTAGRGQTDDAGEQSDGGRTADGNSTRSIEDGGWQTASGTLTRADRHVAASVVQTESTAPMPPRCPSVHQTLRRMSTRIMIPSDARIPNPLPAAFLRGGTSKGVFVNARHLPMDDRDAWAPVFLRLMGSPDALYGRQLDGMGGGISSLSKVMVVGPPTTADEPVDAEYTFAQIGVRDDAVDYTGNCGNLSSVAGIFAVDEGICKPEILDREGDSEYARARVRLWNTNTRKRVDTTFPVLRATLAPVLNLDEAAIAGVSGRASQIVLDFVSPAGARTGTLLPSGHATETLRLDDGTEAVATLMDCANPSVLVDVERSPSLFASQAHAPPDALALELDADAQLMARLELLRQAGARRMGLAPGAQAQPKIALVSGPRVGRPRQAEDVCVRALSMGVPHKAVPMTLGLCVGVAARVPGTVVSRHLDTSHPPRDFVGIQHPGGLVEVGARFDAGSGTVLSANVLRTGRRLMQGAVYWD